MVSLALFIELVRALPLDLPEDVIVPYGVAPT